ncbi:MAG TPA: hypothetical protein VIF57_30135 [Polyangia bacterium]|jgi:hypothetical protein
MLTDEKTVPVARSNLSKHMGSEASLVAPVWNGLLREFRNHLASLLAATAEVKAMTPSSTLPEISPALQKTDWTLQRMNALVTLVDAAVQGGAPATVDLDKVIEGALRLAAPALGHVAVSFDKPHRIDVRNQGTALECLIAGLILELAHAGCKSADPRHRQQIDVHAHVGHAHVGAGRGDVVLAIDSSGLRPSTGSWRVALAHDLASQIGATVTAPAALAGFIVRLDSSS